MQTCKTNRTVPGQTIKLNQDDVPVDRLPSNEENDEDDKKLEDYEAEQRGAKNTDDEQDEQLRSDRSGTGQENEQQPREVERPLSQDEQQEKIDNIAIIFKLKMRFAERFQLIQVDDVNYMSLEQLRTKVALMNMIMSNHTNNHQYSTIIKAGTKALEYASDYTPLRLRGLTQKLDSNSEFNDLVDHIAILRTKSKVIDPEVALVHLVIKIALGQCIENANIDHDKYYGIVPPTVKNMDELNEMSKDL